MKSVGRRRGRRGRGYLGYNYWVGQDDQDEPECHRLGTDNPDIRCYPTTLEKRMDGYKPKGYPSLLRQQKSYHEYPP